MMRHVIDDTAYSWAEKRLGISNPPQCFRYQPITTDAARESGLENGRFGDVSGGSLLPRHILQIHLLLINPRFLSVGPENRLPRG